MLPNSRGYFLLELLLSLSAWLMLSSFLLPLLLEVRNQSFQVEVENQARKMMYEELQARMMDHQNFTNYNVVQDGIEYQIIWGDTFESERREVCVKIENNTLVHETKICGIFE